MFARLAPIAVLIAGILLSAQMPGPPGFPPGVFLGRGALDSGGTAPTTMFTPLITSTSVTSNAATRYLGFAGGNANSIGTSSAQVAAPIAIAGTISSLSVQLSTTVTTGTWTFVLNKNGTDDANFKCSITSGTTCTYSATTVTVAAGDLVVWALEPTSTPTAQTLFQVSATLTATTGISAIFAGTQAGTQPSTTVPNYAYFGGAGAAWLSTELLAENVIPTSGTIDNLFVAINATPSPGTYAITVNHNTSATSLTCTISSTSPCSDTNGAHAFTVAAGDTISVQVAPSSTPASRFITVSARWTPTINGEALLFGTTSTFPSTNVTRYLNLNGTASSSGTEANFNTVAGSAFTVKKLYVQIAPQPGAAATRTITLRANTANAGSPGALSCTIGVGVGVTGTCNDTTNSYLTSAADLLDVQTTITGTDAALTQFTVGAVAFITP